MRLVAAELDGRESICHNSFQRSRRDPCGHGPAEAGMPGNASPPALAGGNGASTKGAGPEKRAVVAVIPARYASSRLPGKPLLAETGRPLIQHVVEAARR